MFVPVINTGPNSERANVQPWYETHNRMGEHFPPRCLPYKLTLFSGTHEQVIDWVNAFIAESEQPPQHGQHPYRIISISEPTVVANSGPGEAYDPLIVTVRVFYQERGNA